MAYEPLGLVPRYLINQITEVARACVPAQYNGSFIIPFPAGLSALAYIPGAGSIATIQLVGLAPSQQIALHADASIAPAVRYHVVLRSNDACWSYSVGTKWTKLSEGMIYRMDPAEPHGAVNWGETVRLHLMIDVEL